MRLTTVGTGTAAPSPTRVQAAHLIEHADVRLLLDCGSGAVFRMAASGMDWRTITAVAITHFHADHISDLFTLSIAWRHGMLPPRAAPVTLIGPPGFDALLARLETAFGVRLAEMGYPITVREITVGGSLPLGEAVVLRARKVPHTDESVAYSVEADGRRLVYTGDTGFDAELGRWARGADCLLCECSLPESMAMDGHLTPRECGALAAQAQAPLLALTHFYPPVEQVDIRREVAAHFGGLAVLAVDGWSVEV